ncbi:TPA: hypothetical protein ACIAIA_004453, partial [Enterobacter asburiae]
KLVALRVDDDGVPTSWDSLPVHFTGGFIESPIDELDGIADLPRYKVSSDFAIQQRIADALDTALVRHYEQFGNAEHGKTAVIFLADRWVAIEGGYAPDEMRDAVEYIKRKRKEKADAKAMAESSPFFVVGGVVHIKQSVIQPVNNEESCLSRFVSERVSEALREATRPGGIIHAATKR